MSSPGRAGVVHSAGVGTFSGQGPFGHLTLRAGRTNYQLQREPAACGRACNRLATHAQAGPCAACGPDVPTPAVEEVQLLDPVH